MWDRLYQLTFRVKKLTECQFAYVCLAIELKFHTSDIAGNSLPLIFVRRNDPVAFFYLSARLLTFCIYTDQKLRYNPTTNKNNSSYDLRCSIRYNFHLDY